MAAPNGKTDACNGEAKNLFIIDRGVNGGIIMPNTATDTIRYNLPTSLPGGNITASSVNSAADQAHSQGGWATYCIHGFTGDPSAYNPFDFSFFTSSVNTQKGYGDVWIDSMVNIAAYWIAQGLITGNGPTWNWTLPAHFPPGHYLRVKVTGGTLKQNGQALPWSSHGYYEVSLDEGSLTLE
jgi:hypothetical protein